MKNRVLFIALLFFTLLFGCKVNDPVPNSPKEPTTNLFIEFHPFVNSVPVVLDSMGYVNFNGDTFSVKTIKYFISRLTFHKPNTDSFVIHKHFYFDKSLEETMLQNLPKSLFEGEYNAISFTVGFNNQDNVSNMFTANPEYQMYWPSNMGGGYHYQKLEGRFLKNGTPQNFNFHAGALDKTDYSIRVKLTQPSFNITQNDVKLEINMEIQNWFKNPIIWDFNYFGSAIMQNHEAQSTIQKNGHDVFSILIN
ncbi:MAG: MbnP family protein [Salibacteraceae bacterium]